MAKVLASKPLRVSGDELTYFTRQVATMLNAGISLKRIMQGVAAQPGAIGKVGKALLNSLESGRGLADGMGDFPEVFPPVFRGLTEVGERSSTLSPIMNKLADLQERDLSLRQRLKAAITYPACLGGVCLVSVVFFVYFILPTMEPMFGARAELPLPTKVLVALAGAVRNPLMWAMLALLGGALWLCSGPLRRKYQADREWQRRWARWQLTLPALGPLNYRVATARSLYGLAAALESGMPFSEALRAVSVTTGNAVLCDRFLDAREAMFEGYSLEEALADYQCFPPLAIHMIVNSAQISADRVPPVVRQLAQVYDEETDYAILQATNLLEPVMLIVLGVVVSFLILASVMPMVQMINNL